MALGAWNWLRGVATLNLEGLTLTRGELSTGAYGEGFVDRRHPHTYAHELMAGAIAQYFGVQGSVFAGRGFVPFGSDDPMARPFEKYPVNHHLSQVLERLVAVGGGPPRSRDHRSRNVQRRRTDFSERGATVRPVRRFVRGARDAFCRSVASSCRRAARR